jgi:hypothetical protein
MRGPRRWTVAAAAWMAWDHARPTAAQAAALVAAALLGPA